MIALHIKIVRKLVSVVNLVNKLHTQALTVEIVQAEITLKSKSF